MPDRLKRLCCFTNCAEYQVRGGYCAFHANQKERERAHRLGPPSARGYDARHRRARRMVLRRDPICTSCGSAISTVADHKKRLRDGGKTSQANLQGLCAHCHNAKSGREAHGGITPVNHQIGKPE